MALKSWINSANDPDADFPIQNLPYGVFRHRQQTHIGVAVGDHILDLHACVRQGLLSTLPEETLAACSSNSLNSLMSLKPASWSALRSLITALLAAELPQHSNADRKDDLTAVNRHTRSRVEPLLVVMREATMQLPAQIGDYTDFYASIHHATRVGKLFRPDHPLMPNYKYVPIGYHGRASSIVVSGHDIPRPCGQMKSTAGMPVFGPSRSLDYELEVGIFIGQENPLGQSIPISEAEDHIFGLCLVNDWSARDIQSWESQPLGPFLAKNFATTVSPWVVPMEALAPYRMAASERPRGDPEPLPYLSPPSIGLGAIDLTLDVYLQSRRMREAGVAPTLLSSGNLRDLYWTMAQLLTHHASNGCNLRPGDLLATGTISGAAEGSEGCLLEKTLHADSFRLPNNEVRTFLEDGDQVTFRAHADKPGLPRIGFGECTGTVVAASLASLKQMKTP